ncbi:RHS repeat domain-containing protein [Nostoc sp.]|uniref:RHS repeat domain-containing protein n=1 Tax=Nostoc sp. TaxID=1180 RepID=UPI002FF88AD7
MKTVTDGRGVTQYNYDLRDHYQDNGTVESRQYDIRDRSTQVTTRNVTGTIFSDFKYTLDGVGNRKKVEEYSGRSVDYTYDSLYRLTEEKITDAVNGNRIYDYTYNKVGNRKTKSETVNSATTVTNYAYDANDRLLNETVNQQIIANYTYDHNGNTLRKTENGITTEYTWNYENRLIAARVKDANGAMQQSMQYRYNDNGIRVAATVDGVERRYLIDEMQPYAQVLEEYSSNGAVQVEYVYGNDLIAQEKGSDRTFYHVDGLGSTRILTDATGNVVSTYDYDAYGQLINSTGGVENKYLFAGEQYDQNLGDYYLRQRYYNSSTGRFTRRDTYLGNVFDPTTLNKYIYTNSNPVNGIDPSGLFTLMEEVEADVISEEVDIQQSTLYTTTPFVLQAARITAGFLALAAGVVSYILIEEAKKGKKDQFQYKLYPDNEKTRKKIDELDDKDVNQMRVQLQYKEQYDYGIALLNVPEVGVNQPQVFSGLFELWQTRRNATWFPLNRYESNLVGAIVYVSNETKYIGPTNQGRYQVASGQWDGDGRVVKKGDYRVDVENLRGTNLRTPSPKP